MRRHWLQNHMGQGNWPQRLLSNRSHYCPGNHKFGDAARFHGSLWGVRYWRSCSRFPHQSTDESVTKEDTPPSCPYCGKLMHRDVLREEIPRDMVARTNAASREPFISIGTAYKVVPASGLSQQTTRSMNRLT